MPRLRRAEPEEDHGRGPPSWLRTGTRSTWTGAEVLLSTVATWRAQPVRRRARGANARAARALASSESSAGCGRVCVASMSKERRPARRAVSIGRAGRRPPCRRRAGGGGRVDLEQRTAARPVGDDVERRLGELGEVLGGASRSADARAARKRREDGSRSGETQRQPQRAGRGAGARALERDLA